MSVQCTFSTNGRFVRAALVVVAAWVIITPSVMAAPISIRMETQSSRNQKTITIVTDASKMTPKAARVGTQIFTAIQWHDESHSAATGAPDLPRINRWIAVSANSRYSVKVQRENPLRISNITIMPRQPDTIDDGRKAPFAFDPAAYRRLAGLPTVKFGGADEAKIGPANLQLLSVSPFAYDPANRLLVIYQKITVTLRPTTAGQAAPTELSDVVVSQQMFKRIAPLVLNQKDLKISPVKGSLGNVLIITTNDLLSEASRLKTIHPDRNFAIATIAPTTSPTSIKSLISNTYGEGNLEAVVIVGDESKVGYATWNEIPSDSWYSYISGNDNISDVSIGRIPAANTDEARLIIDKISRYQENHSSGYASKKVMLVAHAEEYPGKYTANMETVRKASNPLGFEFNTQYGGKDATNDSIASRISEGFAIVNYRGHGSATTWSGWGKDGRSFGSTQVNNLPNTDKSLTMFFNIACDTGAFHLSSRSMAENMLLVTPETDSNFKSTESAGNNGELHRGAVAVIAATKPSYTDINHRFAVNLFALLQANPDATVGDLSLMANNKLITDANGSMNDNTRMYLIFGDPLLRPLGASTR